MRRSFAKLRYRERPVSHVPWPILVALVLALTAQVVWHGSRPTPVAHVEQLPVAPPVLASRLAAMGEPIALARMAFLWIQAFDDPPGVTVRFKDLNYERMGQWLSWMLVLDPRGQAPLMAASRIYINVDDPVKKRLMLDLVHRAFLERPNERWRWMAEATLTARHRLKDLTLALTYAEALTLNTNPGRVPPWARSLSVLVLEDLCEVDAAKILLGGLLANGAITDAREEAFMRNKLEQLEREKGCPQRVESQFPQLGGHAPATMQ
jgi:hypothetical protein